MTNVAIGPGGDKLVIFRDRDINGKEASQVNDRGPADNQAKDEEDDSEKLAGLRMR